MNNDPFSSEPKNEPPASGPGNAQPPVSDWRAARDAARQARHAQRRAWRETGRYGWDWDWGWGFGWSWIFGAILVLIGLAFLVQNLTGFYLLNWWALFIFIPAFGMLSGAWASYKANRRLSRGGRSSLIFGLLLALAGLGFLFNVNWGLFWPVLLILAGVAILVSVLVPG
jgi:hypothetical protein